MLYFSGSHFQDDNASGAATNSLELIAQSAPIFTSAHWIIVAFLCVVIIKLEHLRLRFAPVEE